MNSRGPIAIAAAGLALLAGCATPGALHVYTLPDAGAERTVTDVGDQRTVETPSFLQAGDTVTGFAYDPFTDHFFLRLAPGDRIRVVDRPDRSIKRELTVGEAAGGGDLAVRPRDGHLFLLQPARHRLVEATRLGKVVRTIPLAAADRPAGIALDPARNQLLLLAENGRRISRHDLNGRLIDGIELSQAGGASLGFDAERREFYVPLRDRPGTIGIFDESGGLRRTHPAGGTFVDVGVRSFVRVF